MVTVRADESDSGVIVFITTECVVTPNEGKLSAWLDRLQLLAHYLTGPLVPNARGEYCPAQA